MLCERVESRPPESRTVPRMAHAMATVLNTPQRYARPKILYNNDLMCLMFTFIIHVGLRLNFVIQCCTFIVVLSFLLFRIRDLSLSAQYGIAYCELPKTPTSLTSTSWLLYPTLTTDLKETTKTNLRANARATRLLFATSRSTSFITLLL